MMASKPNTAAIKRFLAAVEHAKSPRAADCRAVAALIRGLPEFAPSQLERILLSVGPPSRGHPAFSWEHYEHAVAMLRLVGKREPTAADFQTVADKAKVSRRTIERHWKAHREHAVLPLDEKMKRACEAYAPEIAELQVALGDGYMALPMHVALRMAAAYWEQRFSATGRDALRQKFARIVDRRAEKNG